MSFFFFFLGGVPNVAIAAVGSSWGAAFGVCSWPKESQTFGGSGEVQR